MKFILLLIVLGLFFMGCGKKSDPFEAPPTTTTLNYPYEKVCIEGIVYVSAYRRMAVYINKTTLKPTRCKMNNSIKEE